jgi:putative restriction endonuclease
VKASLMELIATKAELSENVARLQQYLHESGADRDFAVDLIRQGICFVVTEQNGKPFFSPSRFVGYRSNTRHDHLHNDDKDGRETNAALEDILKSPPAGSDVLEAEYEQFCTSLGIAVRKAPFGIARKFWDLR